MYCNLSKQLRQVNTTKYDTESSYKWCLSSVTYSESA